MKKSEAIKAGIHVLGKRQLELARQAYLVKFDGETLDVDYRHLEENYRNAMAELSVCIEILEKNKKGNE